MPRVSDVLEGVLRESYKAARRISKNGLNPDGRIMRRYERVGADKLAKALNRWRLSLFRGLTAETLSGVVDRVNTPDLLQPLADALVGLVQEWAQAGADFGRDQVERSIYGVHKKINAPGVAEGLSDSWELANVAASQWARDYGYDLVKQIQSTTAKRLGVEVAGFIENGETMQAFSRRMATSGLFSPERARMIAVTEVTRAYAQGNMQAWNASGVVEGKEWNVAQDELVCPLCGPLDTVVVKLSENFPSGGGDGPPRHPRCRCWLTPVVMGDE